MMLLKWLFPGSTAKGDDSPIVEKPDAEFVIPLIEESQAEPAAKLPIEMEVLTETAAIIVYDLQALAHRRNDDVDWWADAAPELEELRNRNLLILGVQADGFYDVEVTIGKPADHQAFSLHFPSGLVFIGPGEEITGGERQPTGHHGGFFVTVEPGDYAVAVRRVGDERISLALDRSAPFENTVSEPVRI